MAKAKDKKGEFFLKIFPCVEKCFGLNPTQGRVVAEVHSLSNENPKKAKNGWCYASKEHLAEKCGIGRRTVFRALDELLRKGLIRRNRQGYLKPTKRWVEAIKMAEDGLGQGCSGPEGANMTLPGKKDSANMTLGECQNDTEGVPKCHCSSAKMSLPMRTKEELKREDKREDATHVATPLSSDTKKGKNQSIVSQTKEETVSSLIRLFSSVIGKKLTKKAMGQARGIVQNLVGRNYKQDELEGAVRWGVEKKGMVDMKQLPNIVNWYIGNKKKEKADLKSEMGELGPAGREALEDKLDV